jgi:hypothetical protein
MLTKMRITLQHTHTNWLPLQHKGLTDEEDTNEDLTKASEAHCLHVIGISAQAGGVDGGYVRAHDPPWIRSNALSKCYEVLQRQLQALVRNDEGCRSVSSVCHGPSRGRALSLSIALSLSVDIHTNAYLIWSVERLQGLAAKGCAFRKG